MGARRPDDFVHLVTERRDILANGVLEISRSTTAAGGSNLHLDERGTGSAVVLLHGMPSAPEDFEPLVAALAPRHRVLVPHLPGYGRTPAASEPRSMDETVAQLEARLLEADVGRVAIGAFSAGAYQAVSMALRRRLEVSRLLLFAPSVGLDATDAQVYREIAAATRAGQFDPRPSWLARMASSDFVARDPAGAARVLSWLDAAPLSIICDGLEAAAAAPDLRPRLPELTCQTLVVTGTADRAVPTASVEMIARAFPHATLERLEGVGHAMLLEAPAEVVALARDFLSASDLPGLPSGHAE